MTAAELFLAALMRAQVAGSLAITLVLMLRLPCRQVIGAQLAYKLWLIPPVTAAVAVFPSLSDFALVLAPGPHAYSAPHTPGLGAFLAHNVAPVLIVWAAGVALMVGLMLASELRFRRLARLGLAGPAVMGLLWPRMVTPSDHETRFDATERELIRRHEQMHIRRGDPLANLAAAAAQALSWFNPLVHAAAALFRLDQELACDAAVLETRPRARRLYGETLLKAHLTQVRSPLACAWAAGRHPLEVRLSMLAAPAQPGLSPYMRGAALVLSLGLLTTALAWSLGPQWGAGPNFTWPAAQSQGRDLSQ